LQSFTCGVAEQSKLPSAFWIAVKSLVLLSFAGATPFSWLFSQWPAFSVFFLLREKKSNAFHLIATPVSKIASHMYDSCFYVLFLLSE